MTKGDRHLESRVKFEQGFLTHLEEVAAVHRGPKSIDRPGAWSPHVGASLLWFLGCCLQKPQISSHSLSPTKLQS